MAWGCRQQHSALLLLSVGALWSASLSAGSPVTVWQQTPSAEPSSAPPGGSTNPITNPNTLPECPEWFKDYEAYHAAARGQPGTKYLVHQVPDHKVGKSGGFGDRLRGMLYALRVAAASERVLLYTWARPVELHDLLVPSGAINWSTSGIPDFQAGLDKAPVLRFMNGAHHPVLLEGKLGNMTEPFVVLQTNARMEALCKGCPELSEMDAKTACVWNRLFRPTDAIYKQADQELQRMYGNSSARYVAVHLRLGGFTGEGEHERGKGPLKNFAGAIRCANQLARQSNISSSTPILLVTDNHHLRTFIQGDNLLNVVTPSTEPIHIDQALHLDQNVRAHSSTVVDLILLSRGVCLVTSPGYRHGGLSGFSHHGWLLGGAKPCHIDFRRCI